MTVSLVEADAGRPRRRIRTAGAVRHGACDAPSVPFRLAQHPDEHRPKRPGSMRNESERSMWWTKRRIVKALGHRLIPRALGGSR